MFHFSAESQFARCLDQSFQIVLTPEEEEKLLSKYEDKPGSNMVNYQKFADVIDCGKAAELDREVGEM